MNGSGAIENGRPADDPEPDHSASEDRTTDEASFSLEDLGAAYAEAIAQQKGDAFGDADSGEGPAAEPNPVSQEANGSGPVPVDDERDLIPTPEAIVEAALFVGHPENQAFTAARLASVMRDVTPEEVDGIVHELNASYREHHQGIRIASDEDGYRMVVAPEFETMRLRFSGKIREAVLSQPAVEVLALVAYQPGITARAVTDLRGRESATVLSQMVRRRLLEVRRERPDPDAKVVPCYYPAERLFVLLGIDSIEDLPQVEETWQ
ncbi:MAG: SMC-Scp complex subunit ScpB [Planctomycetota bacterium]